jgi:hypothetical protein
MEKKSLKELSKTNWAVEDNSNPGDSNLIIGCLQRIADSTEIIAKDKDKLQRDYEYMKQSRDDYRSMYEKQANSNRSLRGVITKLKKKLQ